MGHGASKPDPGMELRPGMRPIRRKIEEVKRRSRARRPSVVSTAELLCPEEREGMVDDDPARQGPGPQETAAAEEKVKEEKKIDEKEKTATAAAEEKEEEEKRKLEFRGKEEEEEEEEKDDDEKGRKLGSLAAYEDMRGSPSFRFYCTDLARVSEDDSSVKIGDDRWKEMKKKKKKDHERGHRTNCLNTNEDSDTKPWKKDKGRRLKALTKAPGHVYNLLSVRNCYCNSSSASDQDNAGLLSGKAAS